MVKISICMASYNGMPFIEKQVDSIRLQMASDDELVISDHGSSDGTLDFLSRIEDARVKVSPFRGPKGPVANFENALRLAQNAVIVLADQDDLWLPNRLDLIRQAFMSHKEGILCLVTDGQRIDSEGKVIHASNLSFLRFRTGFWKNVFKNSYMGCCMAFSRELLHVALPFPRKIPMHDSWLGILAERFGEVQMLQSVSYQYRVHGANLSHKRTKLREKLHHRLCLLNALLVRILVMRFRRRTLSQRTLG